jgi:hypothetical protein
MLPVAWAVMPSGLHRTYGVRHRDFITLFVLTQIAISQVPSGPTDSLPFSNRRVPVSLCRRLCVEITPHKLHALGSFPPSLVFLSAPSLLGCLESTHLSNPALYFRGGQVRHSAARSGEFSGEAS